MANWESLIGEKIEANRDTHKVCKIEDAGKRNQTPERKAWERELGKRRREAVVIEKYQDTINNEKVVNK